MCAVERWSLLPLPRIPSDQHSASDTADHLWDPSCLFCWNVLPRCLALCVALPNEVNQSISSVLLSLLWPLPTVLVYQCERTCRAVYVPVSAEVYMWCSPSFLEVYREKTWFSWPAKVTQQQLIMLFSTCVSIVDWWMEHKCGHVCHGSWTKLMWYASPVCHQWPLSWDVWLLCTACLPESWADGWKQLDHLTIANTPLNVTARGPQHCRSERTFHCLAAYEQSQRCEFWPSWAEVRAVGEICRSDLELASTANAWPGCGW